MGAKAQLCLQVTWWGDDLLFEARGENGTRGLGSLNKPQQLFLGGGSGGCVILVILLFHEPTAHGLQVDADEVGGKDGERSLHAVMKSAVDLVAHTVVEGSQATPKRATRIAPLDFESLAEATHGGLQSHVVVDLRVQGGLESGFGRSPVCDLLLQRYRSSRTIKIGQKRGR